MSYHDAIIRIAVQDWNKVAEDIQLRNIPDTDMPRLLLDCIFDLQRWQGKTRGLLKEIGALQARTEQYQ